MMKTMKGLEKERKFPIERPVKQDDDKSPYGFQNLWDSKSIKRALNLAEKNNSMPKFCLSKIEVHPSGYCNLNCGFCYGERLAPTNSKRTMLPKEIIEGVFKSIRQELPDENPLVILAGLYSEPLTHPDIKEILRKIGHYGFRFGLYTNGSLMDEEMTRTIVDSACKSGAIKPSYISFNVTSSLVTNSFEKVLLPKIRQMSKVRKGLEDKIQINAPILAIKEKGGYSLLEKVVKELNMVGVDNIRLSFPWEKRSKERCMTRKEYNKSLEIFKSLKNELPDKIKTRYPENIKIFFHCFVSAMSLSISPEGDVYPCPEVSNPLFKEKFSYGSLYKNKLSDIWHGKKHLNFYSSTNPFKEGCECCPIYEKFNILCQTFKNSDEQKS